MSTTFVDDLPAVGRLTPVVYQVPSIPIPSSLSAPDAISPSGGGLPRGHELDANSMPSCSQHGRGTGAGQQEEEEEEEEEEDTAGVGGIGHPADAAPVMEGPVVSLHDLACTTDHHARPAAAVERTSQPSCWASTNTLARGVKWCRTSSLIHGSFERCRPRANQVGQRPASITVGTLARTAASSDDPVSRGDARQHVNVSSSDVPGSATSLEGGVRRRSRNCNQDLPRLVTRKKAGDVQPAAPYVLLVVGVSGTGMAAARPLPASWKLSTSSSKGAYVGGSRPRARQGVLDARPMPRREGSTWTRYPKARRYPEAVGGTTTPAEQSERLPGAQLSRRGACSPAPLDAEVR